MTVIEVNTPSEYKKARSGKNNTSGLVVIKCSTEWCGPCKQIAPAYEQLSNMYDGLVTFVEVDVEKPALIDNEDFQDIRGVPTFKFIKNGKQVAEFSGANIKKVKALVEEHSD